MTRLGTALIVGFAAFGAAAAQGPYPTNNSPITLPSGTTVRVRDLIVFRGLNASALTIFGYAAPR